MKQEKKTEEVNSEQKVLNPKAKKPHNILHDDNPENADYKKAD
ncbi:hypothetical protein [Companilactobacillus crustorum]|nr:hypothetical protein [Companilactobacillus crustorum]APU72525.1 hypothetical protein BI355_2234 [Companilactobacillus crustorum]WDT64801.1 hypothetical protein NV391_07370 [Companilactobacillus crustorum]